jgi:hypothetical protein
MNGDSLNLDSENDLTLNTKKTLDAAGLSLISENAAPQV